MERNSRLDNKSSYMSRLKCLIRGAPWQKGNMRIIFFLLLSFEHFFWIKILQGFSYLFAFWLKMNEKANLRDLIAATGLVILLKLDLNRRFFSPCDLEIWWMTPKNNRAPLLCYFKLFASFRSHWWIQTGVTVRKRLIWVNIDAFLSRVTLKFDGWPSKTIGHLFYATSSFVQHFVAIGEFKLELQSGNAQSGSNFMLFRAVWPWNLKDDLQKQQATSSMLLQALCSIS